MESCAAVFDHFFGIAYFDVVVPSASFPLGVLASYMPIQAIQSKKQQSNTPSTRERRSMRCQICWSIVASSMSIHPIKIPQSMYHFTCSCPKSSSPLPILSACSWIIRSTMTWMAGAFFCKVDKNTLKVSLEKARMTIKD